MLNRGEHACLVIKLDYPFNLRFAFLHDINIIVL